MGRGERLPFVAVLLAALAVAAPTISFDFVLLDDDYTVFRNPDVRDLANVGRFFHPGVDRTRMGSEYLPLTTTSFALDHAVWGGRPAGFHATNALLYVVGCLLLWRLFLGWLRCPRAAAVAAVLFALHPVHTENYAWISDRKALLNGVFVFCTLLAWRRFRESGACRHYVTALLCFVLAFLSKYTAASLPLLLVVHDLLLAPAPVRTPRRLLLPVLPFFAVTAAMTGLALTVGIEQEIVRPRAGHLWTAFTTDPQLLLHYVRLLFWPTGQCALYAWPHTGFTAASAAGLLLFAALAAAPVGLRRRAPLAAFGIAWFLILLLPVLNLFPKSAEVAERFLYLPSAGAALLVGWAWQRASVRCAGRRPPRALLAGATLLVASALGTASLARARVWRDSFVLLETTLAHPLGSPVGYDQLGLAWLTLRDDPQRAGAVFAEGVEALARCGRETHELAFRLRFHLVLARLAGGDRRRAAHAFEELDALSERAGEGARREFEERYAPLYLRARGMAPAELRRLLRWERP